MSKIGGDCDRKKFFDGVCDFFFINECNVFISTHLTIFRTLQKMFIFQKFENMSIFAENDVFRVFLTLGAAKVLNKDSKLPIRPFVVPYNDTPWHQTYTKNPNLSQ